MIECTLSAAAAATGGNLNGDDAKFRGISTDTRSLKAGELFFALRGPNFDGTEFVGAAASAGAAGAVVERDSTCTYTSMVLGKSGSSIGRSRTATTE